MTSLDSGQQLDYGYAYDYDNGTFTVGNVPEPATWWLTLCAIPPLIVYWRRTKRAS
jgi:hypothetical protein